jgi:ABC-type antimicrobial peptide transport system permease subunit
MLMAVLERIKEIGMLMAIGMNKTRVFLLIMYETVFLSLTGGILGVLAGAFVSKYFETHKIDLSLWAKGYIELGYDPFVYCRLEWPLLVNVTFMVIITGILASIYPAWKALSYNPANALRIE